jgi:hypothetical protein
MMLLNNEKSSISVQEGQPPSPGMLAQTPQSRRQPINEGAIVPVADMALWGVRTRRRRC